MKRKLKFKLMVLDMKWNILAWRFNHNLKRSKKKISKRLKKEFKNAFLTDEEIERLVEEYFKNNK